MPTILTPQGWVKVAPAARKRAANHDPAAALLGPLAYFSCRPPPPTHRSTSNGKDREQFPYDLDASAENLKRRGQLNAQGKGHHHQSSKHRSVSEPIFLEIDPGAEVEIVDEFGHSSFPLSSSHQKSKSKSHAHAHGHSGGRRRPPSSSASSSTTTSTASSASDASGTSYHRHRPVQATHAHAPRGPRVASYGAPPAAAHPPPPSIGRSSVSYNWYNATTPLNM